jgi:bifunctional non-homologous end joining protein LigD
MAARTAARKSPKEAVDAQLARYRAMRDFNTTSEPRGGSRKAAAARELPFVIQKHAATRLHYDFRLGWRGVLKSWAVTKGPSYFTGDKRLAVQVEDHPMEYGGFEGIIPKGQYGGGTVMVWDQGTWEPHGDVDEGLAKGSLKFTLHGSKLQGRWTLVRMGGRAAQEKKPNWLLIKEHDEFERTGDDPPVTEDEPDSVVTGRDLSAIAAQEDHVWNSNRKEEATPAKSAGIHSTARREKAILARNAAAISDTPEERSPKFVAPQLAVQAKSPPASDGWIHELKLDGYRIQARIDMEGKGRASAVALLTRKGLDWTARMPQLAAVLSQLPVKTALLDGEAVVLTPSGGTSFAKLQAAFQEGGRAPITYFAFDLLHLDGHNLRGLPLEKRKRILETLIPNSSDDGRVRFSEHLAGDGAVVFSSACRLGAEGIVSKRASSRYRSGRSADWVKVKCVNLQEFVVGGFTLPKKGGHGIGALLLGYYAGGKLVYAGRTGTGFTQKTHQLLRDRLDDLRTAKSPFERMPAQEKRDAIWVKPVLVAEVSFATWTADNLLRQAAFKGLREDKPPSEVAREAAVPLDTIPEEPVASSTPGKTSRGRAASKPKTDTDKALPVRLTHPEKVLDAESKLSKQALAEYYWEIAPHMLPHIAHRPLSLVRCPDGSGKPCFFQKHLTGSLPAGIEGVDIRDRKGVRETYISLSTAEALVGLAQMGVLEIHPWGSQNDSLETPDRLIFDLDPDESIPWSTLADSAREVRARLKRVGLQSFVKSTGGKGLHVIAPIAPEHEWPAVKEFAHSLANEMAAANPTLYLTKMTKAARKGKIYIDYLRNERGATSVAPFSPRARAGIPVAIPLDWKELDEKRPPRFLVADFSTWKTRLRRDPWKKLLTINQPLPASAMAKAR